MPSIIEQIAADLKISNASVSRALNDRPGVSAALRERILERARELNYTPNFIARGLATSQTFTLGFFVCEKPELMAQTDPFYGEVLRGVEEICSDTEYHVAIGTLTQEILNAPNEFRFVREKRIDGMLLAGPDIPNEFIMAMQALDIPTVLVDNKLNHSAIDCVNPDDEEGGELAAKHLIDGGHREIGILSGPRTWHSSARRVRGMQMALLDAGLQPRIVHVERTTIASGETAAERLFNFFPTITGICAVNDAMALGAIRHLERRGRHVPNDVSVIGFDDIDWASLNEPPLTTIHVPKRQLGREAARRLLGLLSDSGGRPVEIAVSVRLVERGSARPLTTP